MRELNLWSEDHQNRMDHYFLKKVNHTHNNQLKELIKRIGSLSGFLDPNLIRMVLGGEVQALSLPQIADVINLFKEADDPDWVIMNEQGYLSLNPELSIHLEEKAENFLRFTKASGDNHAAVLMIRLCHLINLAFSLKSAEEKLSECESINYQVELQRLDEYFPSVTTYVGSVTAELRNLSDVECPQIEDLDEYLAYFSQFEKSLIGLDQHLETLRQFDARFESVETKIDIDLSALNQNKERALSHLKSVHIVNEQIALIDQELERWSGDWTKLYKNKLQAPLQEKLISLNERYAAILNNEDRIEYYTRLNNPEREIKRELKIQRSHLASRVNLIKWGKRAVDDKRATLNATHALYQKLVQKTDDIKLSELDSAFLNSDVLNGALENLDEQIQAYQAYLKTEIEQLDGQINGFYPEINSDWNLALGSLKIKLTITERYARILDNPELSSSAKLLTLKKAFRKDRKSLECKAHKDLNHESRHLIKSVKRSFVKVQDEKRGNPLRDEFEQTLRLLRLATDPIEQIEIRQPLLLLLKSHLNDLSLDTQMEYHLKLMDIPDAKYDAKILGIYCQEKLVSPKDYLLKRIDKSLKENERELRLIQIKEKTEMLSFTLVNFQGHDLESCLRIKDSIQVALAEMHEYQSDLHEDLQCIEIEQALQKYFQLGDLILGLLERQEILLDLQSQDRPEPRWVTRLNQSVLQLQDIILKTDPDVMHADSLQFDRISFDRLNHAAKVLQKSVKRLPFFDVSNRYAKVARELQSKGSQLFFSTAKLRQQDVILEVKSDLNQPFSETVLGRFRAFHRNLSKYSDELVGHTLNQFNQTQLKQLQIMEFLIKLDRDIRHLRGFFHQFSDELAGELSEARTSLYDAYSDALEMADEELFEEILTESQAQITELYETHLNTRYKELDEKAQSKIPKGLLEWISHAFRSLKHTLIGKSEARLEEESLDKADEEMVDTINEAFESRHASELWFRF